MQVEENYKKLSPKAHILLRPDSYIGSATQSTEEMWIFDKKLNKIVKKEIKFVPGLLKIFDEIIVNAADNFHRDRRMDKIEVMIDQDSGMISVKNNGKGIPVEIHKEHNIYVPELIFGHLLTSSSYNDDEKKVIGGRNGYGAKLTNIYSKKFILETVDMKKKKYIYF